MVAPWDTTLQEASMYVIRSTGGLRGGFCGSGLQLPVQRAPVQ